MADEEKLSHLNLFSVERHHLRGKLIKCFKMLNTFINMDPTELFIMDDSTQTRNNGAKFKCTQVDSEYPKFFFIYTVVWQWSRLALSVVQCSLIASFMNNLDANSLTLLRMTTCFESLKEKGPIA